MFAIVEIAGFQYKVKKDQLLFVNRLNVEEGKSFDIERVLLLDDNGTISIGTPAINGTVVKATVLEHLKGDKVIVFKSKRRKGYKVKNGHRQYLSKIQISEISR